MADIPEHEERQVRDYVNSQSSEDDQATLVQKVGSRRILRRHFELYDVHSEKSRWWVITDPMNLYSQDDFPEADMALTFHLGLGLRMAQNSRTEIDEERKSRISGAWRRYQQATDAMDSASEAEDFQAVGVKCREALLALVHDLADEQWLHEVADAPKQGDFRGWGAVFAEKLADGRMRAYMKGLVDGTWHIAVGLQHSTNATPWDAEIVIDATGHLLGCFGMLLHLREKGAPERCPRCGSYGLDEDVELVQEPDDGYMKSDVCRACEWRSERNFTTWDDHFGEADIESYLKRSIGLSDRLHPGDGA